MRETALSLANAAHDNYNHAPSLVLSIAAGPTHTILRPSELEEGSLAQDLLQKALFGDNALFSTADGNDCGVEGHHLVIRQGEGKRSIQLDAQGNLVMQFRLEPENHGLAVIKENLEKQVASSLRYASWALDKIDPTQRLTHVAVAVALLNAEHTVIRTRAEQNASPNSYSMGLGQRNEQPICLSPAHRPRAALSHEAESIAEDLITLLRREAGGHERYG